MRAPPGGGAQFFGGGSVAKFDAHPSRRPKRRRGAGIDGGAVPFKLSGDLGGFTIDPSSTRVTVDFRDANLAQLGHRHPDAGHDIRSRRRAPNSKNVIPRVWSRWAPAARISSWSSRTVNPVLGNYNNAYADNLSLTVGANLPDPGPPPHAAAVGSRPT